LAAQVAQLARSGLPLEAGLRALSEELVAGRLSRVLAKLADQLEAGQPIDAALESQKASLPTHLRGLIVAGVRTGRLAELLEGYASLQRTHREIRRRAYLGIAYPLCLLLAFCLVFFLLRFVVVDFGRMFGQLGVDVPVMTTWTIAFFDYGVWVVLALMLLVLTAPAVLWLEPHVPWFSSLARWMPVIGPLLRWSRLAQFAHMMQLFVENQVPLPEALRFTANGLGGNELGAACRRLAGDVEAGRGFCDSLAVRRQFPARLVPLIEWGERTPALADAFGGAASMCDDMLRVRAAMNQLVLLPVLFLAIVVFVGSSLLTLFMPLIAMVTTLSSPGGAMKAHGARDAAAANNTPSESIVPVLGIVACLLILGVAFWVKSRRRTKGKEWLARLLADLGIILSAVGWTLIIVLSLAVTLVFLGPFGPVLWLLAVGVTVELFRQRRIGRQDGLLWLITVSAERGIPLAPAIQAFAREYGGRWHWQICTLAAELAHGIALPNALKHQPGLLPAHALPLVRVGCESGNLPAAARKAAAGRFLFQPLWQAVIAKVFYLSVSPPLGVGCFVFLMIKIVPQFGKMFKELHVSLPPLTMAVIAGSDWLVASNLALPLILLAVFLPFYVWLRCSGAISWNLPGMSRFMRRLDSAVILDTLALVTARAQPLSGGMDALSQSYPSGSIRRRLRKVVGDVARGVDAMASLLAHGLLSRTDAAVLRAAQQVGNLPWAMTEMADSNRRRLAYRLNLLLQTVFPLIIILYGIVTMIFVTAFFMVLPAMIEKLAQR
jgi:type II secretory pathway component PulF